MTLPYLTASVDPIDAVVESLDVRKLSGCRVSIEMRKAVIVVAGHVDLITFRADATRATLLSLLGLLDRPSRGTVRFLGEEVNDAAERRLTELRGRFIGFVFQDFRLVPHLDALSIVRDTTGNEVLLDAVEEVRKTVREGEGIARPMGESGVFDDLVVNMVDVGEATGELDRMLLKFVEGEPVRLKKDKENWHSYSVKPTNSFAFAASALIAAPG